MEQAIKPINSDIKYISVSPTTGEESTALYAIRNINKINERVQEILSKHNAGEKMSNIKTNCPNTQYFRSDDNKTYSLEIHSVH